MLESHGVLRIILSLFEESEDDVELSACKWSLWDKTQWLTFRLEALYVSNSELQRVAKLLALAAATAQLSLV
jgi:hypothetical protein